MFDKVQNKTLVVKGELNVNVNEIIVNIIINIIIAIIFNIIINIIIAIIFNIESTAVMFDSKCNLEITCEI